MERRTVRMAVAIAAILICAFGLLAVFYVRSNFGGYASQLDDNRYVAKNNGSFMSEDDYFTAIKNDPDALSSEALVTKSYGLADRAGHLQMPAERGNVTQFIEQFEQTDMRYSPPKDPKKPEVRPTEEQFDGYVSQIEEVIYKLVAYSQTQSLESNYNGKKRALVVASIIASGMDGRYSFLSFVARGRAQKAISDELRTISEAEAPKGPKKDLVAACMPFLTRRFRIVEMMRKEELRVLQNFEITLGKRRPSPNSINYKDPEKISFSSSIIHQVPIVKDALTSRVYEAFSLPIHTILQIRLDQDNDIKSGVNSGVLAIFQDRVWKNPASSDLLYQLCPWLLDQKDATLMHQMESNLRYLSEQIIQ
jgi:hypothetical protein